MEEFGRVDGLMVTCQIAAVAAQRAVAGHRGRKGRTSRGLTPKCLRKAVAKVV
jgi:hypothetical protein